MAFVGAEKFSECYITLHYITHILNCRPTQGRPSPLRPWCISPPVSDFPLCFLKILRFFVKFLTFYLFPKKFPIFIRQNFWWPFFLVITNFEFPPYFASFSTFPPGFAKIIISPYFHKCTPCFRKIHQLFTNFVCISPHTLTMMHLCITQCTYWTPCSWKTHLSV